MLLTTATPAMCCTWVRQLNKGMNCEYGIWYHTVHPHMHTQTTQRDFIIKCTHTWTQSHKQAKCKTQFSFLTTLLCLCVLPLKKHRLSSIQQRPSLSLALQSSVMKYAFTFNMLGSRVNTHGTKGIACFLCQSQRQNLLLFASSSFIHQYSAVDNLWCKLKLWDKCNYSWPPWVTLSQTQTFCLHWSSAEECI